MPIHTAPVEEVTLKTRDEVAAWARASHDSLRRVPIDGVLEHGAAFSDDEYLGDGDTLFRFNAHAFQSLCQRVGFRVDQLACLETPLLSSQVLNDLYRSGQFGTP
jgi:hypothetical protein